MPVRDFVKDPETGKPATVVTSYQVVELTDLEAEVTAQTAARDAKATEVENLRSQLEVAQADLDALEVRLNEAKSELEGAQGVVAEPAAGVDAGTDGTSVPVTVATPEAPAENLF